MWNGDPPDRADIAGDSTSPEPFGELRSREALEDTGKASGRSSCQRDPTSTPGPFFMVKVCVVKVLVLEASWPWVGDEEHQNIPIYCWIVDPLKSFSLYCGVVWVWAELVNI